MDFDDTPEEATFRAECRRWLAANAELKARPLYNIHIDEYQYV